MLQAQSDRPVVPVTAPVTPIATAEAPSAPRAASLWRSVAIAGVLVTFLHAFLLPLSDIDLPMHLAVGEWIARHHAVPTVEPFAWTRAGAPYFAYSWLAQLGAYLLLAAVGPIGLHLLHAVIVVAAVLALLAYARAARLAPWPTLLLAIVHFVVLTRLTPTLRPQELLFVCLPLAWTATERLRGDAAVRDWRALALLFVASALAANTHILFPLTGAPVFALALTRGVPRRRIALAAGAVVLGWLCTPYALEWPAVFRLNFAPNLLFRYPTGIAEYQPGFISAPVFGILLAALPWLAGGVRTLTRRDAALALMWLVGLLGFAHAEKALAVWWLVSLPLAAAAAARVPEPASPRRRAQLAWIPIGFGLLFCLEHYVDGRALRAQEGTLRTRSLPGDWYAGLEQLASWLDVHAHPAQRARLFTTFNLGSYLTWRLPRYSASIDSRTIFPDSVAAPEAMTVRAFAGTELGPWRDADVAIVPHDYPVAAVLDTATGWQRVVLAPGGKKAPGLWARRAWLDSAGVRTLR